MLLCFHKTYIQETKMANRPRREGINYGTPPRAYQHIDQTLGAQRCCNCHRTVCIGRGSDTYQNCPYKLSTIDIDLTDLSPNAHRRKFCFVKWAQYPTMVTGQRPAKICGPCYLYLSSPSSSSNPEEVWPAFVWSTLQNESTCNKAWKLLPLQWKTWWKRSYCELWNESWTSAMLQPCIFKDHTLALEADLNALKSLRWAEDIAPREKSFILAEVKCPAGCAEFKHKANALPLDIVWEFCLDTPSRLYSSSIYRSCINWFRNDYEVHEQILLNTHWECTPSIAYNKDTRVPEVLCCRYHNRKHRKIMIHACRSPAEPIATDKSSQFTSVTAIPRTLRKSQASTYSLSFQIAKMEGCYYGLDTMYLKTDGGNYHHQSLLAWKQEVAAYVGRSDIRGNVSRLSEKGSVCPGLGAWFAKSADQIFPHWKTRTEPSCRFGSNYVSLEDSIRLQHNLFFDRHEMLRIQQETTSISRVTYYRGCWPRHLAWVHPGHGIHGKRFPTFKFFRTRIGNNDARSAWLLTSMLISVPELWHSAVNAYKPETKWEGWVLTYCTKNFFPQLNLKSTKDCPFKKVSDLTLFTKYIQPPYNEDYDPAFLRTKFLLGQPSELAQGQSSHTSVAVRFSTLGTHQNHVRVVIVLRPKIQRQCTFQQKPSLFAVPPSKDWELRYAAFSSKNSDPSRRNKWKGTVYAKHANCNGWWRQTQSDPCPTTQPSNFTPYGLPLSTLSNWTALVFVRKDQMLTKTLRNMVLGACGGQSVVVCSEHKHPHVVVPKNPQRYCSFPCGSVPPFCGNAARYVCPNPGCYSGTCRDHFNSSLRRQTQGKIAEVLCPSMTKTDHNHFREDNEDNSTDANSSVASFDSNQGRQNMDSFILNSCQGLDDIAMQTTDPVDLAACTMHHNPGVMIPTTNAATEPIYGSMETESFDDSCITNHALLNTWGSCLVRRNRKLQGTLAQQSFLQKLASNSEGTSIPLVYPEAMLFSDIFPISNQDGSMIGAIPAALLHGDQVLNRNGFCSLQDMYRTRIMNPGLLAAANPKYHFFAFDCMANFSLRGNDSRLILQRGFAESQGTGGVTIHGSKQPIFDSEHVENRAVVNKLSATTGEAMPTYFYTHSLSMRTHFGMRIVWDWLTGDEILTLYCREESLKESQDWRRDVIDSAGSYLLRLWMEICQIWLLYITKSPEQPMGCIGRHFARFELQDASPQDDHLSRTKAVSKGNLPHMHCLFWTNDKLDTDAGFFKACDRIRGYVDDIIRPDEAKSYIRRGVFKDNNDILDFKATMARFLKHEHRRRCFVLRKAKDSQNYELVRICKAPNNWKLSPAPADHCVVPMHVDHAKDAIQVLIDIGVAKPGPSYLTQEGRLLEFVPLMDCLKARKHIPPCLGDEGMISPVIGALVAINPNSDNCQMSNSYFVARYLAKYVVKIDEYCTITVKPPGPKASPNNFGLEAHHLLNTKITSNRIAQQDLLNRGHMLKKKNALGINVAQVYMMMFGYASVYTNLQHVKFCTDAYGHRPAIERKAKPIDRFLRENESLQTQALTPINTVPAHHARHGCRSLQSWRHFTQSQLFKAFDDLHSPLSADPVTVFGFRPPELLFVMEQPKYYRWFTQHDAKIEIARNNRRILRKVGTHPEQIEFCVANLDPSRALEKSTWISANTKVIKVRARAINEIVPYIRRLPNKFLPSGTEQAQEIKDQLLTLFATINEAIEFHQNESTVGNIDNPTPSPNTVNRFRHILDRFVSELDEPLLPVPWCNPVKPTQPHRFLIHLLLRFGYYTDEYSLFEPGHLRLCFIKAGLLDPANVQQSCLALMKRYFNDELKHIPSGTPTLDKYIVASKNVIQDFFRYGRFHTVETPSVLYCRLKQDTTENAAEYSRNKRERLVRTIHTKLVQAGIQQLPTIEDCLCATVTNPTPFDPLTIPKSRDQPDDSHREQLRVVKRVVQQIQSYTLATTASPHGVCIVGGGGVGKTTCALLCLLYARCQGLNINATALVSERAQELGVDHLNCDYSIPLCNYSEITSGQLAEKIIGNLYRHPEKLEFHRTTDIEMIDEMGPIPAELWSARDIALRYIRDSNKPNGGKLDIVSFDHLQTHPVRGTHPLLSPLVTGTNIFMRLNCSVRVASTDTGAEWRKIQEISRLPPEELQNPQTKQTFVSLLTTYCSFIHPDDVDKENEDTLFVYGKNAPIRLHQQSLYRRLEKRSDVLISCSADQESDHEGRYIPATDATKRYLDHSLREQQKVYFFLKARYRITFNKPGSFSNGQLAFLATMPSKQDIAEKRPVQLLLAPPGSSYIPSRTDTEESLLARGWQVTSVGVAPENDIALRSGRARRTSQYGLQLYVGSTWHSTMGKTLPCLITRIDNTGGSKNPYSVWDPTQIVIMLSRTPEPQDTKFITDDPEKTALEIYAVLQKESPFRTYLSYILTQLCTSCTDIVPPEFSRQRTIYRPRDVNLPSDMGGFAYMLISTRDTDQVYIGSCQNLLIRYNQHNSGYGAQQTAPPSLRPWGMLAFVSGFCGREQLYLAFEQAWIAAKEEMHHHDITVNNLISLGHNLVRQFATQHDLDLQFHHAGTSGSPSTVTVHSSSSDGSTSTTSNNNNNNSDENSISSVTPQFDNDSEDQSLNSQYPLDSDESDSPDDDSTLSMEPNYASDVSLPNSESENSDTESDV